MKKVQLRADNVLIKVETVKSSIILPDSQDGKPSEVTKAKLITVLEVGDAVEDIKPGDHVVLGIDPLKSKNPYNNFLEAKENPTQQTCNVFYYFIKPFDIVAKVVK
jgi:hypothetical protein